MSTDATAAPRTLAPQISAAAPWPLAPQRGRGQDTPVLAVSMAPQLSAAVPRVLAEQLSRRQRPWRRSAAVPWRPPTQGRTWPPPPLCGAKGHGAAKLICGTRVHGTVAWARPLPCWRRRGLGATLAGSAAPPTMAPQSCAAVPWLVAPQNGLGFENTFGHRLFSQFF